MLGGGGGVELGEGGQTKIHLSYVLKHCFLPWMGESRFGISGFLFGTGDES